MNVGLPQQPGTVHHDARQHLADAAGRGYEKVCPGLGESREPIESCRGEPGQNGSITSGQDRHPKALLIRQGPGMRDEHAVGCSLPAAAGQPPAHRGSAQDPDSRLGSKNSRLPLAKPR